MTQYLLDVNILISLLDRNHLHHPRAMPWFEQMGHKDWVASPTTQNGVIRIMGGRTYGPTRYTASESSQRLRTLMGVSNHSFIADDASLLDEGVVNLSLVGTAGHVTDTYLLRLAVAHDCILATMDGRLDPSPVANGRDHLYVIPK